MKHTLKLFLLMGIGLAFIRSGGANYNSGGFDLPISSGTDVPDLDFQAGDLNNSQAGDLTTIDTENGTGPRTTAGGSPGFGNVEAVQQGVADAVQRGRAGGDAAPVGAGDNPRNLFSRDYNEARFAQLRELVADGDLEGAHRVVLDILNDHAERDVARDFEGTIERFQEAHNDPTLRPVLAQAATAFMDKVPAAKNLLVNLGFAGLQAISDPGTQILELGIAGAQGNIPISTNAPAPEHGYTDPNPPSSPINPIEFGDDSAVPITQGAPTGAHPQEGTDPFGDVKPTAEPQGRGSDSGVNGDPPDDWRQGPIDPIVIEE